MALHEFWIRKGFFNLRRENCWIEKMSLHHIFFSNDKKAICQKENIGKTFLYWTFIFNIKGPLSSNQENLQQNSLIWNIKHHNLPDLHAAPLIMKFGSCLGRLFISFVFHASQLNIMNPFSFHSCTRNKNAT